MKYFVEVYNLNDSKVVKRVDCKRNQRKAELLAAKLSLDYDRSKQRTRVMWQPTPPA